MSISIQISERHLNELKAFYISKREALLSEIDGVNDILTQIGEAPNVSKSDSAGITLSSDAPDGYPFKAVWIDKIKYILYLIGGAATTSDLADKICSIEIGSDRRKVVATISSVLSTHSKIGGAFVKSMNERRESVFSVAKERQLSLNDDDML
jgi:hypothetical protein